MKEYLSKTQLENIKEHKYTPCSFSPLDQVFNKYLWTPVSLLLPNYVSPNMVTLAGVLALLFGVVIIYSFDNTLTKPLPLWVHLYMFVSLFFCQTMDAVDGKHARNTNRASPMGQLIDHGLDIFSYTFQLVYVAVSHRIGGEWAIFFYQAFCYTIYFTHTWEEYYSGMFSTHINNIGVLEFQLFIGLIILTIPIFGINSLYFTILGVQINFLIAFFFFMLTYLKIPIEKRKDAFLFFLPMIFFFSSMVLTQYLELMKTHTIEILVLNGLVFSQLTAEQIIGITSKSPAIIYHFDTMLYTITLFICLFITLNVKIFILVIFSGYMIVRYFFYLVSVIRQLMDFLKIGF